MSNKPIIVIGAGGHAKVLVNMLIKQGRNILGLTASTDTCEKSVLGIPVMGSDDQIFKFQPSDIELVNGIGSIPGVHKKYDIYKTFKKHHYQFATVVDKSAIVANAVELSEGVQVMAGAIIQPGVTIGVDSIINSRASVDHDCCIGAHVHIAPGVTLSGSVQISDRAHIGTGASVIQSISIGEGSVVAAGAVVYRNVPSGYRCMKFSELERVR